MKYLCKYPRREIPHRDLVETNRQRSRQEFEHELLNEGPHIGAAVRMLADIIHKMEAHQYKQRSLYRPLSVAQGEP